MQRRLITFICLLLTFSALAFSTQRGYTQDSSSDCPTLVKQALEAVGNNCGGLGRNSACYGFNRVNATFSGDVTEDFFSSPSDQTNLKLLESIDTAALNETINEWGVAVMSVQANIPNSLPGQAISFILLGDVTVDNAVPADAAVEPAAIPIDVTTINDSNIRTLPTTKSNIIGSVSGSTALSADAINPTKDWLRVVFDDSTPGWISRGLVKTEGDLDSLPVFASGSQTPMQAFYFRTGIGSPSCTKAPDVLVVQGPEKVAVDITANGANINIGSTIGLRSLDGNQMQVFTISGEATVNGVKVPTGFTTILQMSDDGKSVIGEPSEPRPLTQEELDEMDWFEQIPTSILNYPIFIPTEQDAPIVPLNNPVNNNNTIVNNVPAARGVDCSGFKLTSPLDGLNFGMNSFYWDAAPGATSYRVNVEGAGSKEVTAPITNANFDISSAGFGPQLSWSVDALFNGQVVCSTASVTIPRQWAPPPPAPPEQPPFGASWECGEYAYTVKYGGLPAGTTSIIINFNTTDGEPSQPPPIVVSVPPESGFITVDSYTGTFTLSSGSIVAEPSGLAVGLPDLTCDSGMPS